jgi:hypothetical protein
MASQLQGTPIDEMTFDELQVVLPHKRGWAYPSRSISQFISLLDRTDQMVINVWGWAAFGVAVLGIVLPVLGYSWWWLLLILLGMLFWKTARQAMVDGFLDKLEHDREFFDLISATPEGHLVRFIQGRSTGQSDAAVRSDHENGALWRTREKIINDYGVHMERMAAARLVGSIRDVKELPHEKEAILEAIFALAAIEGDEQLLGGLFAGAIGLADYQEGVGNQPLWQNGKSPTDGLKLDPLEYAKLVVDSSNGPNAKRFASFRPLAVRDHAMIHARWESAKRLRNSKGR